MSSSCEQPPAPLFKLGTYVRNHSMKGIENERGIVLGTPTDLVRYFLLSNGKRSESGGLIARSMYEFMDEHPDAPRSSIELSVIVNRLIAEGLLTQAGATPLGVVSNSYWSEAVSINERWAAYGTYDFVVYGFPYIRHHFKKSVLPIIVIDAQGNHSIGSSFLLDGLGLVTAAHCIRDMRSIQIPGWNPEMNPLVAIGIPNDPALDVAYFYFGETDPFPDIPKFILDNANILDEVLTMGYPPIPGFDSVLVSETASVAGYLKSTTGQLITSATSYLDKQGYLLTSVRIKGGSSGGPVINKRGGVVGIISGEPSEFGEVDTLGFGLAIPYSELNQWLFTEQSTTNIIHELPFEVIEGGIRTALQ